VSTAYGYDVLLSAVAVTETAVAADGGTSTRTTTTTYRNSGASPQVESVAMSGGVGVAVAATSHGYDPVTGLQTTLTAGGQTQSMAYDDFGQLVSFTDATGAVSRTTRDSRD
jgi:YD repeat-containing protein